MRTYLLNIGNTRAAITAGMVEPGAALPEIRYLPTGEVLSGWRPRGSWRAVVSCVVPTLREALSRRWGARVHFVGPDDFPNLDLRAYEVSRLGADRLCNLAALAALLPGRAAVAVDCGTALNTVALDAHGRFRGGVILPGRETALKALAANAAQLPEFAVTAPHEFNPLSCGPESGIRNGVDIGILGAIETILRATRRQPGFTRCRIWFTGGDAPFFVKYLPPNLRAELAPIPLTLYGIHLAAATLR